MITGGFIAGLMAGSLPFIYSQCVLTRRENKYIFFAVGSAAFIILLTLLAPENDAGVAFEGATFNFWLMVHLFIGGVFAAAAMVIPGISGAMVLMLFGLFPIAMHTITNIRVYLMSPGDFEILGEILMVVLPLGVGIVAGILIGSKMIAWLLAKFHSQTYFVILGLVFGTVFVIFSDPATYQSHDEISPWLVVFTAIALACGAATSLLLGKKTS
jgi:putative membrane protein